MGWLIAAGIFAGLLLLPVGIRAVYNAKGPLVWLTFGVFSFPLYPKEKENKNKKSSGSQQSAERKPSDRSSGSLLDFRPLVDIILSFLSELRRRLCVKELVMKLTLAGDDPADLAIHYGQAWSLLGNLVPQLDNLFRIKKRDLSVSCDFTAEEPMFYGYIHITVSLGRLLYMAAFYGNRILREYRRIMNLRKGGSKL